MSRRRPTLRDLFGTRLRVLRNAANLSQEKLALRAGMDRSYVGQVERGEVNISLDNVGKLASGLGMEPRSLFEFGPVE